MCTREGKFLTRENFAALEIPKAPSAIHPNDCNNTTRRAPDRDSKTATHRHDEEGQYLQQQLPDRQHQISYICARNGRLWRVRKRLAVLRKHNPSAAVAKDGIAPTQIRDGKFRGAPWILCGTAGRSPQCVPLVCKKFAENTEFRVGNFAVNLKREISHAELKCHEIHPPLCKYIR